jgi:hypothetical protein
MLGSDVAETPAALKWALGTRAPMLVPQFANDAGRSTSDP